MGSRLTSSILPHPSIPTIIQSAGVHHHMESKNLRRFLGIERSNKAKANRNTHHNERMFRKVRNDFVLIECIMVCRCEDVRLSYSNCLMMLNRGD